MLKNSHPPATLKLLKRTDIIGVLLAPLVQSDRMSASGAEGCRFESCTGYQRQCNDIMIIEPALHL